MAETNADEPYELLSCEWCGHSWFRCKHEPAHSEGMWFWRRRVGARLRLDCGYCGGVTYRGPGMVRAVERREADPIPNEAA